MRRSDMDPKRTTPYVTESGACTDPLGAALHEHRWFSVRAWSDIWKKWREWWDTSAGSMVMAQDDHSHIDPKAMSPPSRGETPPELLEPPR